MDEAEHNARVRALAGRMPTPMLRNAVYALGYSAKFESGTLQGFRQDTLVKNSRTRFGGAHPIGLTNLKLAIAVFKDARIIRVTSVRERDPVTGKIKRKRNVYRIDYDWAGDAGRLGDEVSRRRRNKRRRAQAPRSQSTQRDPWAMSRGVSTRSEDTPRDVTVAKPVQPESNDERDDDTMYGDPPGDYGYRPPGCPVCIGAHDPARHAADEDRKRCMHCHMHAEHQ